MNRFGLRGGHFNATLKEFASLLVLRPSGCSLMKGPFALSLNGALRKILETWGSRLTWTVERQHAAQITSGMGSFLSCASFLSSFETDTPCEEPDPDPNSTPLVDNCAQQIHPLGLDHVGHHSWGTINAVAYGLEGIVVEGLEGACRYHD